jgi:glycine cleavage system aminomethyltransferase T
MSLEFLHTDAPDGPVARSPMAREAAAAGARFETRDGWEVAVAFADEGVERLACREAVGFADRSHLGKLELQGSPEALDALDGMPSLGDGLAARAEDAWWCRIAPERALVLCAPSATAALRARLSESFAGHVLDVTAVYGAVAIAGPLARETFARFCALDLRPHVTPVRGFRPGSVARTPGFVLREGDQLYLALFGAAYGAYMWEVVADTAAHLGGRPVGVDAIVVAEGAGTHA